MGDMVEFPCSYGGSARGYLAVPGGGSGAGVIVVQEWWGLHPQLMDVCDRLAGEGFTALAPDLYHGDLAEHDEMDKAAHLMTNLPMDRAAQDMAGAVEFIANHSAVSSDGLGVTGFCMGGGLALVLGCIQPDTIKAVVPYYGVLGYDDEGAPDWSKLGASVLGHYAENDDFFPIDKARALFDHLKSLGKDATLHEYPGTGHAFANDHNPLGTYNAEAAQLAWDRTVAHFEERLG